MSVNQSQSGAFRKKRVYFSQVSNAALRDNSLSLKAKGLYSLIQSYITIEDFVLYKTTLKKQCIEGEKAFEATWKELKDAGYLIQYRLQDDKGCYFYEYDLLDQADKALADETHSKQNRKTQAEKNHTPKKDGMDKKLKTHTPKKDNMDNGCDGKGGVYNNTCIKNTYITNTDSSSSSDAEEVLTAYTSFKGSKIGPTEKILLVELIDAHGKEKVLSAIEVGVLGCNRPNLKYIKSVLDNRGNITLSTKSINTAQNKTFTSIYKHDWDLDELEKQAMAYMEGTLYTGK